MAAPRTVVKIDKQGVHYESGLDQCEYYIHELTRAALRDVGKFVKREFRTRYYSWAKKRSGDAGRATSAKIYSSPYTESPRIEIGLKKGKVDGFYAYFQEFGTSNGIPKLALLQRSVEENIQTIIEIESKYLTGLEGEAEALLPGEEEIEIEEDDEE